MWQAPNLKVKWGPYWAPDPEDQKKLVDLVGAAIKQGLITERMAIEKLAPIFGIENIDAALEALKAENEERKQKEQDEEMAAAARDMKRFQDADKMIAHADDSATGRGGAAKAGEAGGGAVGAAAAQPKPSGKPGAAKRKGPAPRD